ncbi:MAG: hypothetical protein PVH19_01245 [Planctomycetia bacterium]|jgi:hypothetical protein
MNGRILIGLVLCSILVGCNSSEPPTQPTAQVPKPEPPWSEPVGGLRARVEVLPPEKAESPKENYGPFCRANIEFENVSNVAGQMNIRFTPGKIKWTVVDQDGKELAPVQFGVYDALTPTWKPSLLPTHGTLKFRFTYPGLGFMPDKKNVIADMGDIHQSWIIPLDDSTYYLSGTLTIKKEDGDQPYDWSGTLELPKVEIPKEWE